MSHLHMCEIVSHSFAALPPVGLEGDSVDYKLNLWEAYMPYGAHSGADSALQNVIS
jgi:hypothetical protein